MQVRLTQRDQRLLNKLTAARWLTTSQAKRLFFSEVSDDAVRKRLRKLTQAAYLNSYRPHRMAEAFHALGRKGIVALQNKGVEATFERTLPKQLEHFSGINDIRIAVELAGVSVAYFFAAWEIHRLNWPYSIIPDAVFMLDLEKRLTFLAEYDRGSETVEQFMRKLRFYKGDLNGFAFDGVLVFCETQGRLEVLGRIVRRSGLPVSPCFGARLADLKQSGLLAPIFVDLSGPEGQQVARSLREFGSLLEFSCREEGSR